MNHLRTAALVGCCAVLLVVAGCGSGDDSSSGTDAPAGTDAPSGSTGPTTPATMEPDPTGEIEEQSGVLIAFSCVGQSATTGQRSLELCIVPAVDGEAAPLSEGASPVVGATWSPGGSYLAFVCMYSQDSAYDAIPMGELGDFGPDGFTRNRGGEICVVNADGSSGARATNTGGRAVAPAVSPDGSQLVYAVTEGDATPADTIPAATTAGTDGADEPVLPGLYVFLSDGGSAHQLTVGTSDDFPSWSPDGTQIAFASEGGIALIASDGSNRVQLTDGGDGIDLGPTWSPDGTQIAFTRTVGGTGERETWVMAADGSNARVVYTSAPLTEPNVAVDVTPAWSPDGTRLAITAISPGGEAFLQALVVPLDGGEPVALSPLPTDPTRWGALSPTWSPDNQWLAFTSDQLGAEFALFTVAPDGSQLYQLTTNGLDAIDPTWQP
jgi:Tol biopolymer transport system component